MNHHFEGFLFWLRHYSFLSWQWFFAVITTVIAGGFSVIVCYWLLFDNQPPLTHNTVEVLDTMGRATNEFHAGDVMLLRRDGCVIDEGPALFTRVIRGPDPTNNIYFSPSGYTNFDRRDGCRISYNEVQLPKHLLPGKYVYEATLQFQNNPLRFTIQPLPGVAFHIMPEDHR
jgi:hypothetical protein